MIFYIPQDTTALALGAESVAHALQAAGIEPVRNGSRGMFWLEPLLEIDSGKGRIGYGPVSAKDIPSILDALELDATAHPLYQGPIEKIPYFAQQQRLTFARAGQGDPVCLDNYQALNGFKGLHRALQMTGQEIVDQVKDSGLRGRGGAAFPAGIKWQTVLDTPNETKYIVCNADEGDSGAFSDRYLLEDQPLKVLFGMIICGYVIGSDEGVLYIRGEYPKSIEAINGCINSLKKEGLLGENILGTNFSFDLNICIGQGAYICGEETALIASIEGRRAEVDVRPPFPVTEGLYKKPTVVNNVETLAAATGILINGAEKFAAIGNKKSAGTKLVCFDSFFNNTGVYEVEMGTPMKKVLNDIGGGFKEPIKALQIGGPLGGVIPISEVEKLNLDFQEFTAAGFMLGHASIVSIPKDFPMVDYIHHLFEFTAEESCGKCFPGRLGSYRGKEMFDQAKNKTAKIPLKLLNELLVTMKKGCLCALCGAIPTPIMNILKYFGDEMKDDMVKDN